MKVRHMPAVFVHSSMFVLRHAHQMLAHTFTGTTMRSALGLEPEQAAFERFRSARRKERDYVTLVGHGLKTVPLPECELKTVPPPECEFSVRSLLSTAGGR